MNNNFQEQSKQGELDFRKKRRLQKSGEDILLTGTAAGIANFLKLSPSVIRYLFIIASLFGGYGILIYLAVSSIIPGNNENPESKFPSSNLISAALVLLSVYIILNNIGLTKYIFFIEIPQLFIPLLFILFGLFLIANEKKLISGLKPVKENFHILKNNRAALGVCSGLADYLPADLSFVRLIFVILSFSTFGLFLIVYLILYLFGSKDE